MAFFKMQARASDSGEMHYWTAATRDYAGAGYPGSGTPEDVTVTGYNGTNAGGISAAQVSYDPTGTGLASTDVQAAVTEVHRGGIQPPVVIDPAASVTVTADQAGKVVVLTQISGSPGALLVKLDSVESIPVGSIFRYSDASGEGFEVMPTFTAPGVNVIVADGLSLTAKPLGTVRLVKVSLNEWFLDGDLVAPIAPLWRGNFELNTAVAAGVFFNLDQIETQGDIAFNGTNTITVNETGLYSISFMYFGTRNGGTNPFTMSVSFRVNGSAKAQATAMRFSGSSPDTASATGVVSVPIAAGSTLDFASGNSSLTPTVSALRNMVTITRVGN